MTSRPASSPPSKVAHPPIGTFRNTDKVVQYLTDDRHPATKQRRKHALPPFAKPGPKCASHSNHFDRRLQRLFPAPRDRALTFSPPRQKAHLPTQNSNPPETTTNNQSKARRKEDDAEENKQQEQSLPGEQEGKTHCQIRRLHSNLLRRRRRSADIGWRLLAGGCGPVTEKSSRRGKHKEGAAAPQPRGRTRRPALSHAPPCMHDPCAAPLFASLTPHPPAPLPLAADPTTPAEESRQPATQQQTEP